LIVASLATRRFYDEYYTFGNCIFRSKKKGNRKLDPPFTILSATILDIVQYKKYSLYVALSQPVQMLHFVANIRNAIKTNTAR